VGHCLWTFTVPKLLRPYFLHRRELLGSLCRSAWSTVCELVAQVTAEGVRPGMVAAIHTASSDLRWHPVPVQNSSAPELLGFSGSA
jgi:hypothetical protein